MKSLQILLLCQSKMASTVAGCLIDLVRVWMDEVVTGQGAATARNKGERQKESIGAHISIVLINVKFL